MDEDSKFRELLEELSKLHENELRVMRSEIQQLRADPSCRIFPRPSGDLVLPKQQALCPNMAPSNPVPSLEVEIDILPPLSEEEKEASVGRRPSRTSVRDMEERSEDRSSYASYGRSPSRKDTNDLAREAAKAMMLGQLSSPPAACNKSNKSDDETPSRKESFYGRKETDQSGGSKNSRSGSKSKGLEKEKFAKQKEDSEAKSQFDLSAELPSDATCAKYLVSDRYELILGAVVLSSVVIMAADFHFTGYVIGQEIGFKDMSSLPTGDESPAWIAYLTLFMDIFFFLEVATRVFVLRWVFFKLWVNWLDLIVVSLALGVDIIGGLSAGFNVGVIRLLRLAKIARALRVVRMRRALESLSLLLRCVQSSLQVLFWSLGLLGVIQCIAGMVIGQLLVPYMRDTSYDVEGRHEVYKYFGTFSRTFLTMFEVLFANWAIPARICVENVGEVFIYVFIFYRCFVGYAVLNVVSAVFVQQTMKVAQQDQEYMMNLKQKQAEAYAQKLKRFFMTLDASGDGLVSWEEFSVLLHDPQLQIWMSTLDLETHDLVQLFQMIDDGDGEISVEEFIDGATRLRGMARSLDVAQVLTGIKKVELKIEDLKSLVAIGKRTSFRKSFDKGSGKNSATARASPGERATPSATPLFSPELLGASPEVKSQLAQADQATSAASRTSDGQLTT